jgi:hypothetical protein
MGGIFPMQGSAKGPEDQFPPPSLSGRCGLGEPTFAGMGGKEEDAPLPAVRPGNAAPGCLCKN